MANYQLVRMQEDRWSVRVGNAVLGHVTRRGKGFWGMKEPFTYDFRSTFRSDAGRLFGGSADSLEGINAIINRDLTELGKLLTGSV